MVFLPLAGAIVVVSGILGQLIGRIGARPPLLAGAAITTGGMYWFSHLSEHSTYLGGLLGPMLVTGVGLGLLFVPLSLVALSRVPARDAGLASSLLNTGQQVGGAIGLAALGTVAWSAVASSARSQTIHAAAAARSGPAQLSAQVRASIYHHALAVGIARGFLAASGIALATLVITVIAIRIKREDLAGMTEPAQDRPPAGTELALEQTRS